MSWFGSRVEGAEEGDGVGVGVGGREGEIERVMVGMRKRRMMSSSGDGFMALWSETEQSRAQW